MGLFVLSFQTVAQVPGAGASGNESEPVRVIFDTDMGNDIDDAIALAVLHALQTHGEAQLLAVTVTKDHELAGPFVDGINTFYGRGEIPIGVVDQGATPDVGRYLELITEKADSGEWVYPHDLVTGQDAPEAVGVLRRVLAEQPDDSVVIIQVGFSTNLARLISSLPDEHSPLSGEDLIARKVRFLSVMAGVFPSNGDRRTEYNIRNDVPAARRIAADWPTPIVYSGFEVGRAVPYPMESIERDYGYVDRHFIPEAVRLYVAGRRAGLRYPMWDVTNVIHAIRPDAGHFEHSPAGRVMIDAEGRTRFVEERDGPHRYLTISAEQTTRFQETMVELAAQPP